MQKSDQQTGDVVSRLLTHQAELQKSGQRDIVVIEGDRLYADHVVACLLDVLDSVCLISNHFESAVPFSKVSSCLGQEVPWVMLDLHDGLDADVLCVAAGLVTAGGVLLLLWPGPGIDSPAHADRLTVWQDNKKADFPWFETYLFDSLRANESIGSWISARENCEQWQSAGPLLPETAIIDGMTTDQANFMAEVKSWLSSKNTGVFLLLADRGRGKSTVLGLLADELLHNSATGVLVSAPSRQAAAMLLERASQIRFIAPDVLLESRPQSDLILVDEAAMIPQSMLRQVCDLYPRVIMATTTGGYEGTGQGFLLRFKTTFETSRVQQTTLTSPVRWRDGDRLEAWLRDALLLATTGIAAGDESQVDVCGLQFSVLQAGEHINLFKQAYAMLASAHYRTSPSDFQQMMENPDCLVVIAQQDNRLLGAMLLNREGGLDKSLSTDIFLGKRRPKGHLLAQMITAQTGLKDFAGYRGIRIQRIAVPACYRRQGVGSALIEQATQLAKKEGMHYLGASFALDTGSIEFWTNCQFTGVYLSYAQGKSSGSHSLAVLKPLDEQIEVLVTALTNKLNQQLPGLLVTSLQTMEAGHVVALLRHVKFAALVSDLEINDVTAFTEGERGLDSCFISLQKQVMQAIASTDKAIDPLLVYKAVLHRPWSVLPRSSGSEGKRQLQQRLRELVKNLFVGSK